MTERELIERELILDIISESSKWIISEEDQNNYDAIRLEVMDRAKRLFLGTKTVEAEPFNVAEHIASPEKVDDARSKWEKGRIRVCIDGKHVWKPRSQCVKQPRDNSKGGPAWKWVWVGPQDKKAQEDQMWTEHEREGS